eukprot:IDg10019t1
MRFEIMHSSLLSTLESNRRAFEIVFYAPRAAVRQYVPDIAAPNGHPLPMRMHCSDGGLVDNTKGSEAIVVLPPRYAKRFLHKEYMMIQTDVSLRWAYTHSMMRLKWTCLSCGCRCVLEDCAIRALFSATQCVLYHERSYRRKRRSGAGILTPRMPLATSIATPCALLVQLFEIQI